MSFRGLAGPAAAFEREAITFGEDQQLARLGVRDDVVPPSENLARGFQPGGAIMVIAALRNTFVAAVSSSSSSGIAFSGSSSSTFPIAT